MRFFYSFFLFFSFNFYSQQNFYDGEITKKDGSKIKGLIKHKEYRMTPQSFFLKKNENSEVTEFKFEEIESVDIFSKAKFVKKKVDISYHSVSYDFLDNFKDFKLVSTEKIVEELVSADFGLFEYRDPQATQFFYKTKDSENILPLLKKEYTNEKGQVLLNEDYKVQLYKNVYCDKNLTLKNKIKGLSYKTTDLTNYFYEINECITGVVSEKKQKDYGYVQIKGLVENNFIKTNSIYVDLDKKYTTSFGLEAEYLLPFYNYTFSLLISPNYIKYEDEGMYKYQNNSSWYTTVEANYGKQVAIKANAFSMPMNLRIYPFHREKFKCYASLPLFNLFVDTKSTIKFENSEKFENKTFSMPSVLFFELGFGYKRFEIGYKVFEGHGGSIDFKRSVLSLKYAFIKTKKKELKNLQ